MTALLAAFLLASSFPGTVPPKAELRFGDLATDGWDAIDTLSLSGDGKFALVNGPNHVGRVYSLVDGKLKATLRGHTRDIRSSAALPGGRVVTGSVDGTLRVWDLRTGKTLMTLKGGHRDIVSAVVASADGKIIVSGGLDWRMVVWEEATGLLLRTIQGKRDFMSMAISPDGRRVAVSDGYQLSARGVSDGQVVWTESSYSCSHDKARPLTCLQGRQVNRKKYPMEGGRRVSSRKVFRLNIYLGQVAWSADGKMVAVARENGDVILYAAATGKPLRRLSLRTTSGKAAKRSYHPLLSVALSGDGNYVAAGGKDGAVHVWKTQAALPFTKRVGHKAAVTELLFLPDGRLVSASTDSTGVVWKRF